MPYPFAVGETLTATNLNAAIKRANAVVVLQPAGNSDQNSASMVDWVTLGNVTVPTWATSASVIIHVAGTYAVTAVASQFTARVTLGGTAGQTAGRFDHYRLSERINGSWASTVTAPPTGAQSLRVQAQRTAGTGAMRADTSTVFSAFIVFEG